MKSDSMPASMPVSSDKRSKAARRDNTRHKKSQHETRNMVGSFRSRRRKRIQW